MTRFQDSPRWSILRECNEPPLEDELAVIQGILQAARATLSTIESEASHNLIANTENTRYDDNKESMALLQGLKTICLSDIDISAVRAHHAQVQQDALQCPRRDEQVALIRTCTAILSPSRQIPREIIAKIFLHALDHDTGSPSAVTLDITRGPWPLSQVCRIWREVAVSLPEFWSSMRISPRLWAGSTIPRPIKDAPSLMATLLQRSDALPLHAEFSDSDLDLGPILSDNSDRWKELSFTCHYPQTLGQLNRATKGFSALEAVRLDITAALSAYRRRHKDAYPVIEAFKDAPLLRSLTLIPSSFGYQDADRVLLQCPWEQITHYDGPVLPLSLSRLLAVGIAHIRDSELPTDMTLITLSKLHNLRVGDARILNVLQVPALEHLEVDQPPRGESQRLQWTRIMTFALMIFRSECSLRSLTIGGLSEQLTSVFPVLGSLTSLHITSSQYNEALLRALLPSTSGAILLPKLESLTMDVYICATAQPDIPSSLTESILELMGSRCFPKPHSDSKEAVTRLKIFRFGIGFCCRALAAVAVDILSRRLARDQADPEVKITLYKSDICLRLD